MPQFSLSAAKLHNGEMIALGALELVGIPHLTVISSSLSEAEVLNQYKKGFSALLHEVYQIYSASAFSKEISLEILWVTEPAVNQSFEAAIRLFLIARAIGSSESELNDTANEVLSLFHATLTSQKYDVRSLKYSELAAVMETINDQSIVALVKDERVESLQNQILPFCLELPHLPASDSDLSRLVSILIQKPNCAVSFQLIPTQFSLAERDGIDRMAQALGVLQRGVNDQGIGNVNFSLAEKHAADYLYYAEHKNLPLFQYNVLVFGEENSARAISSRLFSQLSMGQQERTIFRLVPLRSSEVGKNSNFYPLPWAVNELLLHRDRNTKIWAERTFAAFYRLPFLVTGEEASEFFRLPVGSERVSAGLTINESSKKIKTYARNLINAGDITVGVLRSSDKGDTIGFSLKDLTKHMLVVGTPGSGKTTFSVSLLDRLWKDHGIPFLVIEPAKNEYRALIQSIPDLQVFTPGKNFISPFVFNPFVPPKNVRLETYKSTLKTAFAAGVSMTTPLDKIFEETVNNCYSDFRWLDSYTSDDKGGIFNIADFIRCFQNTFDEIGYTGDARNIGRAGVVRLKSLSNLFDNYYSIPIEDLLSKPTVIELAAIENSEQKALIIALLLLSILAYVNSNYVGEGELRNLILLEEAHVLLDGASNSGQGESNPAAIAQGLIKRMLAEIRSYGVGVVIADQSPRKVTTDVVALTDMKMIFRLVENEDKQIIAGSTNMSEAQIGRMSKLRPGEAFLFFGKLDEPEEVITPDYRLENKISITLSDEGIRSLSRYWQDKKKALCPYPQCESCPSCAEGCDYARRTLAREIARRIFNRHIKAGATDFNAVKSVFAHISKLTEAELNDEPFSVELLRCVKVHLWRKIRYETRIPVSDALIEKSIQK